jgi:hypothetical protein
LTIWAAWEILCFMELIKLAPVYRVFLDHLIFFQLSEYSCFYQRHFYGLRISVFFKPLWNQTWNTWCDCIVSEIILFLHNSAYLPSLLSPFQTHTKAERAGALQCWRKHSPKFHFSFIFTAHFPTDTIRWQCSCVGSVFSCGKLNNAQLCECQNSENANLNLSCFLLGWGVGGGGGVGCGGLHRDNCSLVSGSYQQTHFPTPVINFQKEL